MLLFVAAFAICLFVLLMNVLWRYAEDIVGKGLDFAAPITDYSDTQPKADRHVIEISVDNDEDLLLYHLDIFVNGRTDITVTSRKRDRISFSGEMTW